VESALAEPSKVKRKKVRKSHPALQAALTNLKTLKTEEKLVSERVAKAEAQFNRAKEMVENPTENPYDDEKDEVTLERLNDKELIELCIERGLGGASRDIEGELLIKVLRQQESPEILGDIMDTYRDAIAKFLKDYPTVLPQLRCDKNHANCPPIRVLDCFLSAPEIKHYMNAPAK
jgi:hypothetical protein